MMKKDWRGNHSLFVVIQYFIEFKDILIRCINSTPSVVLKYIG